MDPDPPGARHLPIDPGSEFRLQREALFDNLQQRLKDLFAAQVEVVLYDLTSSYFESDPPVPDEDKRRYGYSRDHRSDCVQVVIALVITPEGLPLAYQVMPGIARTGRR